MKYNLSKVVELIRNRRSIRPENYSDRKVHREIVEGVLNSAIWAPTHGMTQPWRFKVSMKDSLLRLASTLPELYKAATSPERYKVQKAEKIRARCESVSVIVFICMEEDPSGRIPETEEIAAIGCAVQNMMLHCTAYGLGSYWSSPQYCYSHEMRDFLGLGKNERCLGMFYMGYPTGEWPTSHRRPIEYVAEWNED